MPAETLVSLRQRLDTLPMRCRERRELVESTAHLFGVSDDTLYRALRRRVHVTSKHRADRGKPRKLSVAEMERYCEVIAAFKVRTLNKKGRHVSTKRAVEILEECGMRVKDEIIKPPAGVLTVPTVNRYLKLWGYDHRTLLRESPAARFQAEYSNQCWHFDLSPSDLKHLDKPPAWARPERGDPTLMLYSVVDDRSGVCYQEYHCVYGEDTEAALRFLYNAMSLKPLDDFPFQGIPEMIYMDNGPISKSRVFLNVMECLGVKVMKHPPKGADERKTTSRAKGKVERPFRTVKESLETLYHFIEPQSEVEANRWLHNYLLTYNNQAHREKDHSRFEDWLKNLPNEGIREMCSWERFGAFAREPEKAKIGNDARVSCDGVIYEVEPDLAGLTVILWRGFFDNQIYVEYNDEKFGPFEPIGGLSTLHRFRKFKKTKSEERADRISALAKQLELPRSALEGNQDLIFIVGDLESESKQPVSGVALPNAQPFRDPDPFQEFTYPNVIAAKLAIAGLLGQPLAKLAPEQRQFIDQLLGESLSKRHIIERVERYFYPSRFPALPELSGSELLLEKLEEEEEYVN
ncbi:MAG: IS481 family transposase [Actinomycetota bacterium]